MVLFSERKWLHETTRASKARRKEMTSPFLRTLDCGEVLAFLSEVPDSSRMTDLAFEGIALR